MHLKHAITKDKKTEAVIADRLVLSHEGWGEQLDNVIEYEHQSDSGKLTIYVPDLAAGMRTSALWTMDGVSTLQAAQLITLHDAAAKAYSQNYADRERIDGRDDDFKNSHLGYKNTDDFTNMVHSSTAMAKLAIEQVANPKSFTRDRAMDVFRSFMNTAGLEIKVGEVEARKLKEYPELAEREEMKGFSFGSGNGLSLDIKDRGIVLAEIDIDGEAVQEDKSELSMEGLGRMLKKIFQAPDVQAQVKPEISVRLVAEAAAMEAAGRMATAETYDIERPHQSHGGENLAATNSSRIVADKARDLKKGGEAFAHQAAKLPELSGPKATAGTLLPESNIKPASSFDGFKTTVALGKLRVPSM